MSSTSGRYEASESRVLVQPQATPAQRWIDEHGLVWTPWNYDGQKTPMPPPADE